MKNLLAESSEIGRLFGNALDAERIRRVREINGVRLGIVAAMLALHVVLGYILGDPNYRGNLEVYIVYAILSAVIAWSSRRSERVARHAGLAIQLVDMPLAFLLQLTMIPTNDDPESLVGFAAGFFAFLVVLSALSFNNARIVLAALVGFGLECYLLAFAVASDAGGYAVAAVLIGGSAVVSVHSSRQLSRIVRTIAEEQVMLERQRALNEAKDQFVATVSHDFRSPLAIVLSSIQTVLEDSAMPEDVRERFLGRALRQCRRLERLVTDLLDLARIENGDASIERRELAGIAGDLIENNRAVFEEQGVRLILETKDENLQALVDPTLITLALQNLLSNALKFTPAGGQVQLGLKTEGRRPTISVLDTGCGIAADELPELFERFYQGKSGTARGDGSGLGLAIVAEVVRKHGGSINVRSEVSKGTVFTVELPVASP